MGLFKTYNYESIVLTDGVTRFVCSLTGSDTSGSGTRANPYATMTKAVANAIAGGYIVFKGSCVDNPTFSWQFAGVIADDEFCNVTGGITIGTQATTIGFVGFKADSVIAAGDHIKKCNIGTLSGGWGNAAPIVKGNFISNFNTARYGDTNLKFTNNTILNFKNYLNNSSRIIANSIIVTSIDLYNFTSLTTLANIPLFQNCLFRKATVWKWNGVAMYPLGIPWGSYGNATGDYLADLISAMTAYGVAMSSGNAKTYFQTMFPAVGGTTILYSCLVVDDSVNPIFNRYDINGNPIDYTLKLDANNIAVTMSSDTMSYVGCYQASARTNDVDNNVLEFSNECQVLDISGNVIAGTTELLVYTGSGRFQIGTVASAQVRNRCTSSNVVKFERGFTLTGFQSQMKSAMGSRFSFGKFQKYNITDAPCLPMESLEVIPYDTIDLVASRVGGSGFPRFSAMFNDKCQMWYHTAGAKINQPVLFSDLAGTFTIGITQEPSLTSDFLTEYGAWAVTNADMVSFLLSSKSGCTLRNIPLYFAKIELNLNYYN